ncbi:MAG: hypothetical protein WCK27_23510 [Verrucomicrobiota bacterium]
MKAQRLRAALADISADADPTRKTAKLASLCSALFRERGVELVVVGGSAIELLTDGAYTSGDLDLCSLKQGALPLRERQEVMGQLGARGGPRSWQVGGLFVDLLGPLETLARTPLRRLNGAFGVIQVIQPEELLVERVLVSVYPQAYAPARQCAKKLAAVALGGAVELDWKEVSYLAGRMEYRILPECKALVREVANELKIKSPLDSY